jgi:hypothetical protein
MVERVTLEAAFLLGQDAAARVRAATAAALALRDRAVGDDHDPRLLHPARTVLILLSDAGCRAADVLAAAAFVESLDGALRPPVAVLRRAAGPAAAALAANAPLPEEAGDDLGDDLLERLVTCGEESALIAVAEFLDHARHLHLRPELDWPAVHGLAERAYAPAAQRIAPPLERRLRRWAEAFRTRRLLRGR